MSANHGQHVEASASTHLRLDCRGQYDTQKTRPTFEWFIHPLQDEKHIVCLTWLFYFCNRPAYESRNTTYERQCAAKHRVSYKWYKGSKTGGWRPYKLKSGSVDYASKAWVPSQGNSIHSKSKWKPTDRGYDLRSTKQVLELSRKDWFVSHDSFQSFHPIQQHIGCFDFTQK